MTTDKERRPPEATGEAAKELVKLDGATTHSVPDQHDIAAWVIEAMTTRQARHARRRAWLDQANAEHRQARDHGLRARHAQKLSRQRGERR